jgi:prepilin-type N-terminal cleavage/methylation domain-containing protein
MKKTIKKSGFTLIELLVVIGLLAALAAILLPTLMGTREDALEGICSYNQAGTLRTLRQYEVMTGQLPNGMHTGLDDTAGDATMKLPPAFRANLARGTYLTTLDTDDVEALDNIGIDKVAYGKGVSANPLGYQTVAATTLNFIGVQDNWKADGDTNAADFSFNGKTIPVLKSEGYSKIIALFVTPTTNWEASGTGWVKGFGVKMDIPGVCPIPNDEATEFAYYVAYVGLKTSGYEVSYSAIGNATVPAGLPTWSENNTALANLPTGYTFDGTDTLSDGTDGIATVSFTEIGVGEEIEPKAVLLGTSCPECGITNP